MQLGHRSPFPAVIAALLAVGVTFGTPATPVAAATDYVANCAVSLRHAASGGAVLASVPINSVVTVTGTVAGDAWSGSCPGAVSGSSWFAISAVNGRSVTTLYGVGTAYAPSGMFRVSTYLEGIDVSHWQGSIDFAKVAAAGKRFVIAKATEGIGFRDSAYTANKSGAIGAGLFVTAYHYARPDLNPTNAVGEADWFVDTMGLTAGMLLPALDLEVHGTLSTSALQDWVGDWLARVYARTGARPMIYTSPSFWKNYVGNTTMFSDYDVLWVAHWGVSQPWVPASNWGGHGWTFWQYTSDGSVPGISGRVDLDRFNGKDLTPVTFGADFEVAASPATVSAKQGTSTTFTIDLQRTFFTLPVDLSVSGLPAGATATLSADPASGSSATLTVTTSKSGTITPLGSYPLTVSGSANGLTRSDTATLTVTDGIAPTVNAAASKLFAGTTLGTSSTPVKTTWSASDPSGIGGFVLQRQTDGGTWTTIGLSSATSTLLKESLGFGHLYRYRVKATDGAGNTSGYAYGQSFTPMRTQETSSAIDWGGSWTTASATSYSGGGVRYAKAAGAWASFTFTGASFAWVSELGPTRGSADVYVDGVKKATVDLYAASYAARQIVFAASWSANGSHTITVMCLGTSGHPRVDVDAFVRVVLS